MTSINYNEFQAGQGVSAPALNENFTLTNTAIENLETTVSSSISSLTSTTASKNGSADEKFSVADATESSHAVNLGQISSNLVPVGCVIWVAYNTAPTGYLVCDGTEVSRSDYADLFAKIGTAFGAGDGSTTFNLPDLIGKVAYGSTTINANSLKTGNQDTGHTHAIQNAMGGSTTKHTDNQNADHKHTVSACGLLPCIKY